MTRSYSLDNWDGHLSKSHKHPQPVRAAALSPPLKASGSPVSATSDLQRPVHFSSNFKPSVVEESLNHGGSKSSQHSAGDASNESLHNSTPHIFEKTGLFEISDVSDTDLPSDIVTDAHNPLSPLTTDNMAGSHLISRNGTRHSLLSGFPETFVPSPALTAQSISTYTADAHGEEEDDDVIIVDRVQTSFTAKNKPLEEAPTSTFNDSLFTPPPSDAGTSTSESPPPDRRKKSRSWIVSSPIPQKIRTVATHVLVPSLSKPKSTYVRMSSLVNQARKRPRRTAQEGLREVLNAVWRNNECLGSLGDHSDGEGEGKRRKKRMRTRKRQEGKTHPVAGPSDSSHSDDKSVVFVNRTPAVKHRVEKKPSAPETTVIDLTLDNDDDKPLSAPTQSVAQVTSPARQPTSEEMRIRIGVIHSISYRTLLFNTRFLRGTKGDIVYEDFVALDSSLPFRRRRALLDNDLEGPSSVVDEFSLGSPVVTEHDRETVDEDEASGYEVIELLDSSSESPSPKLVVSPRTPPSPKLVVGPRTHPPVQVTEPLACPPKIDLAAKFRKKKTAARRTSSTLTPSARKSAPLQPSSDLTSALSRSPVSSLRNGLTQDVVIDDDGYNPRTPLVPSAKALGKRKVVNSPLQPMQLHPDVQPLLPSSRPSETTLETLPACPSTDNFDLYVNNYWLPSPNRPTTLTSENNPSHLGVADAYSYPNPYPNLALSSVSDINFIDHRHHYSPTFSSAEPPAASLLYHSDAYTGTPHDIGHFSTSVFDDPPQSEMNLLPPAMKTCFAFDNGTVNPSLLSGEPLGISEHPELYFPEVGSEFLDGEKDMESLAISQISPSRSGSPSPMTLSSPSKSESPRSVHLRRDADSGTIFVRRQQPTPTSVNGALNKYPRRPHVKRKMPGMVPSSVLDLSSSSEETDSDDSSGRPSIKPHVVRTKSRPTVVRKAAAILPAGLDVGGPKVMIGRQLWPMQEEAAYCHQCRNKTMALKLECRECRKAFCIRCLTLRYPDEPRALDMKEAGCPICLGYCNCTQCCKKRGVEYISTKDALAGGVASRAQLAARGNSTFPSLGASSSFPSPAPDPSSFRSSSPVYPPELLTATGGVYWGVVYAADGSRIGAGFIPAKQDAREHTSALAEPVSEADANAQPRTKKRRVYVGKIHPSWQFDYAVKKSVLEPVPPPKRLHQSRRPRKYVGNKAFLFYKSERMARELADLSPLSSLEEDWEEEDGRGMAVEKEKEEDTIGIVEKAGDDEQDSRATSKDGSGVSLKSLSDNDIMRAIGLGLHACGIQLAG